MLIAEADSKRVPEHVSILRESLMKLGDGFKPGGIGCTEEWAMDSMDRWSSVESASGGRMNVRPGTWLTL